MKPYDVDPRFTYPEESWPHAIAATLVFVLVCVALYLAVITVGAVQ